MTFKSGSGNTKLHYAGYVGMAHHFSVVLIWWVGAGESQVFWSVWPSTARSVCLWNIGKGPEVGHTAVPFDAMC